MNRFALFEGAMRSMIKTKDEVPGRNKPLDIIGGPYLAPKAKRLNHLG